MRIIFQIIRTVKVIHDAVRETNTLLEMIDEIFNGTVVVTMVTDL